MDPRQKAMTRRVLVLAPDIYAGKVAEIDGDLFRYPGQSFYVQPVRIGTERFLVTKFKELEMELPHLVLNTDPNIVYDYQELLQGSYCPVCQNRLEWSLTMIRTPKGAGFETDDKFCRASCCGMVYSTVPQTVRVVAVPKAVLAKKQQQDWEEEQDLTDSDFLNELRKIE